MNVFFTVLKISTNKKANQNLIRLFLCPGQELNLHVLANIGPSSQRVYQFRHLGRHLKNLIQFNMLLFICVSIVLVYVICVYYYRD